MKNIGKQITYYLLLSSLLSQEAFDGYTLFTPGEGLEEEIYTTLLIDNHFNIINSWTQTSKVASMPYLIPGEFLGWENTFLLYPYTVENPTMESGGVGGGVKCLSWDGELIWFHEIPDYDYQHHHDIEPLPNGNVLMLAWERKSYSEAYAAGRTHINNLLNQMWSTAIFEIDPNNEGGADVVWEWHLWDHLIQDENPTAENFDIVEEHPELFDINNGQIGGDMFLPSGDWMHCNTISYNVQLDQIVISSRFQDEIYVIDHSTSTLEASGHSGGIYNSGGDLLYRWGNPLNYNRGDSTYQLLDDQHSINWIPSGYPGEGNFVLYNNGENQAIEFSPPVNEDGSYYIGEDEAFGPNEIVWSSPFNSSLIQGGAFRLPNGNTLVTDCDDGTITEYTESGIIAWEYEDPEELFIARSQKYSIDYFGNDLTVFGDINGDLSIDILDVIEIINIILEDLHNNYLADLNGDGIIDILDIIELVNLILI